MRCDGNKAQGGIATGRRSFSYDVRCHTDAKKLQMLALSFAVLKMRGQVNNTSAFNLPEEQTCLGSFVDMLWGHRNMLCSFCTPALVVLSTPVLPGQLADDLFKRGGNVKKINV